MTNRPALSSQESQQTALELRQLSRRDGTLSNAILYEIGLLRIAAWLADGELPSFATCVESWTDEHDGHAEHFVIYADGEICAACRVCVHDDEERLPDAVTIGLYRSLMKFPAAFINRLVVAPHWRGRHLTAELDLARVRFAVASQAHSIIAATQKTHHRVNHLENLGFVNLGVSPHRTVSYAPTFVLMKALPVLSAADDLTELPRCSSPVRISLAGRPLVVDSPITPHRVSSDIGTSIGS